MKREHRRMMLLIARGLFLAAAIFFSLYAAWIYEHDATGVAYAMYVWIRHFYGSVIVAAVGWLAFLLTFCKRREQSAPLC